MKSLLSNSDRLTAVFAVGALKEINTNGLSVPEDVALVDYQPNDLF